MGLAWFLVYWKWRALRTGDEKYNQAVRFWAKIFGLNFAVGVITGIPMEFQFGTNWADFSKYAGGVIGQTLAMEGMFAFFLESAFVGALIWGENRLGPRGHFAAAIAVAFVSLIASLLVAFPTGDQQAKIVGNHQPITLAAMEGKFEGGSMAGVALIGQPNVTAQRLDNPIEVPGALSFLAYGHFGSFVHGL